MEKRAPLRKRFPFGRRSLEPVAAIAGRKTLVLRALLRQAIPMLRRPEAYSFFQRNQLARTLEAALGKVPDTEETEESFPVPNHRDAPPEEEYEPGCCLEGEDVWT